MFAELTGHSSPADALARLASYDKRDYISFCLGSLALCILLGAGRGPATNHQINQTMMPTAIPKIAPARTSLGKCPREK